MPQPSSKLPLQPLGYSTGHRALLHEPVTLRWVGAVFRRAPCLAAACACAWERALVPWGEEGKLVLLPQDVLSPSVVKVLPEPEPESLCLTALEASSSTTLQIMFVPRLSPSSCRVWRQ